MGKRIDREIVDRVIDGDTGEIREKRESITYSLPSEPEFVKLYLADLLYLVDLPKYHTNVLFWAMQHCNYASDEYGQCVALTPLLKKEIMRDLGIKNVASVNNILSALSKKRIIEHIGRSTYRLNPYLFGRGRWQDIRNLQDISSIEMNVKYTRNGKEISSKIETADKQQEAFALKSHLSELEDEQAKAS